MDKIKAVLKLPGFTMWLADITLVFCAFLWGLGFAAMKVALAVYPAFWVLFFRFFGGTLLMGACFRKNISRAASTDLKGGLMIGLFLFIAMGLQTIGLNYTAAGKQAFLTASYVVMVPLLLWVLRRVFPGWVAITGSLICFAGMGLLTSDVSGPVNVGDILTIVSALFFAAQIIAISHYAAEGDPLVLTFVQCVVCAVLSLCCALFFNGVPPFRGTEALLEIAYVTVFCTFICFLIQNVAQKYTSTTHAAILLGLESVFGVLGGVFILSETLTAKMVTGCCLIFAAVLIVELKKD